MNSLLFKAFTLLLLDLAVLINSTNGYFGVQAANLQGTKESRKAMIKEKVSNMNQEQIDLFFMNIAKEQALRSLKEGGVPIGAVLVKEGEVLGEGSNLMIQTGSPILHGEMAALDNAGRLSAEVYQNSTLYTTLSPCEMCSGTISFFKIPRVVIGENKNFIDYWGETFLRQLGLDVKVLNNKDLIELMGTYIKENQEIWDEVIEVLPHNHTEIESEGLALLDTREQIEHMKADDNSNSEEGLSSAIQDAVLEGEGEQIENLLVLNGESIAPSKGEDSLTYIKKEPSDHNLYVAVIVMFLFSFILSQWMYKVKLQQSFTELTSIQHTYINS